MQIYGEDLNKPILELVQSAVNNVADSKKISYVLEEMNMLRMNIGIEHGNYDYRRNYLKRNVKDDVQIRAFEIASEHKYASCANSIIGIAHQVKNAPPVNNTSVKFIANSIANIEIKLIPKAVLNAIIKLICFIRIIVSKIIEVNKPFMIAKVIIAATLQSCSIF